MDRQLDTYEVQARPHPCMHGSPYIHKETFHRLERNLVASCDGVLGHYVFDYRQLRPQSARPQA